MTWEIVCLLLAVPPVLPITAAAIGYSWLGTRREDLGIIAFLTGMTGWITLSPAAFIVLSLMGIADQSVLFSAACLIWVLPPTLCILAGYTLVGG